MCRMYDRQDIARGAEADEARYTDVMKAVTTCVLSSCLPRIGDLFAPSVHRPKQSQHRSASSCQREQQMLNFKTESIKGFANREFRILVLVY